MISRAVYNCKTRKGFKQNDWLAFKTILTRSNDEKRCKTRTVNISFPFTEDATTRNLWKNNDNLNIAFVKFPLVQTIGSDYHLRKWKHCKSWFHFDGDGGIGEHRQSDLFPKPFGKKLKNVNIIKAFLSTDFVFSFIAKI